jgi:LPS export ABC transporter permease LptF/LPS export ABC transporter permease LptG
MGFSKWLIDRYVARAALSYLFLVAIFLTGALAAQQAGRLLEAISATDAPLDAVLNTLAALLPTLLTLAIPMAVLLAIIIALSQLGSDSELIAMQSAGLGVKAVARPLLLICAVISLLAGYLNLYVAPQAIRSLREIELKAAKYKLESPVEPRTFNTKIPEYVLYIREGRKDTGVWQNVFIYNQKPDGSLRLITSKEGRIDFAKELETKGSELFLQDVVMVGNAPKPEDAAGEGKNWTLDRAGQTRLTFPTNRRDIIEKLQQRPFELDELSLEELRRIAREGSGNEKRIAEILAHKKLALSLSPLVLGLLGVSLGMRVRRGGRGAGLVLGLIALISYQLVALVGEQTARKGTLAPAVGIWLAPVLAVGFSLFWLLSRDARFGLRGWKDRLWRGLARRSQAGGAEVEQLETPQAAPPKNAEARHWLSFPAYLDSGTGRSLALNFLLTLAVLTFLFLTFTLFELWRFIAPTPEGYWLMGRYLFYLLPLTLMQTLPGAGLIAALATYALISRRLEAVAWWASGLSAYRLLLPVVLFALTISASFWYIQESVMPAANLTQDALRAQIKGSPKANTPTRQWLAPANSATLYSYNYDDAAGALRDLSIFDFGPEQTHLRRMIHAGQGILAEQNSLRLTNVEEVNFVDGKAQTTRQAELIYNLENSADIFRPAADKPSQLSAGDLRAYLNSGSAAIDKPMLATSLYAKYAAPFGALALIILGAPLALAFDRRRTLNALAAAVVASLLFWILTNVMQQFGARGLLPPVVAAWTPPAIFGCLTAYLLSRVKT